MTSCPGSQNAGMNKNIFGWRKSVILLVIIFISLTGAIIIPSIVRAENVSDNTLSQNETWATTSEPYVIQGEVVIPSGITLIIASSTNLAIEGGSFIIQGSLVISDSHIDLASSTTSVFKVKGGAMSLENTEVSGGKNFAEISLGGTLIASSTSFRDAYGSGDYIQAYGGSSVSFLSDEARNINSSHFLEAYNEPKIQIKNSNFSLMTTAAGLSIYSGTPGRSFLAIASSSFSNQKGQSIESYRGVPVHISDSVFLHGKGTAISLYTGADATIEKSNFSDNDIAVEAYNASTTIFESNIENNKSAGVIAYGGTFAAKNVWWGDASGPLNDANPGGKGNSITGMVDAVPWLTERWTDKPVVQCCSNILFIPGLEGSRLYKQGTFFENQLWEPNRNGDVQKLFLNENGKSIDSSIYTRDIIGKTNITGGSSLDVSVYDDFVKSLNDLKGSGKISEWRALPYDWRFGPETILKDGIKTATGTIDVLGIIEQMASSSKSGKVAIVTHSNGGLIAKVIISELQKRGEEKLVDQLIMVAAPEFGTPSAIAALLHGDGQEFAKGILLNKNTARQFGVNMFTAYNLLPSEKFFSSGFSTTPVVSFSNANSVKTLSNLYGIDLSNRQILESFLMAIKNDRQNSKTFSKMSTDQIAVLNKNLIISSDDYHAVFDSWIPPANIRTTSIVGTGVSTVAGVSYEDNGNLTHPERAAKLSQSGDGIVLAGEPGLRTGSVYYVDLQELNTDLKKNYSHADLMNAEPIRSMLSLLVTNTSAISTSSLPQYVFGDEKNISIRSPYIFSVYSPVSIEAFDSSGRRTGVSSSSISDEYDLIQQDIPNSSYISVGESKQIVLQDAPASIHLQGIDVGTFTFKVETPNVSGISNGSSTIQSFVDVPVTPLSKVDFYGLSDGSGTSSPTLSLDRDGDGRVDEIIQPTTVATTSVMVTKKDIQDFLSHFESDIKIKVQDKERRKHYVERVVDLEKELKSGDIKKVSKSVDESVTRIGAKIKQGISKIPKDKNKYMIDNADRSFLYQRFVELKKMISAYKLSNQK